MRIAQASPDEGAFEYEPGGQGRDEQPSLWIEVAVCEGGGAFLRVAFVDAFGEADQKVRAEEARVAGS